MGSLGSFLGRDTSRPLQAVSCARSPKANRIVLAARKRTIAELAPFKNCPRPTTRPNHQEETLPHGVHHPHAAKQRRYGQPTG